MLDLSECRVALGLSGGVDSAVAAKLLQRRGFEVTGVFLDMGNPQALEDARCAAAQLDIPLVTCDIRDALEEQVCRPFESAYLHGETPNPCVLCNPSVKFRFLIDQADQLGAKNIATGHYARARDGMLFKGMPANDQSYMLCRLTRAQAARLITPLGDYEKTRVRAMAEEMGLPIARKPDSMEICFIPDRDYVSWLARRCAPPGPGKITFEGREIGTHEGIHRWTVGQRLPGLYNERRLYVSEIRAEENEIRAALWEDLFHTEILVRDISWLIDAPTGPIRGSVRVRHTKWENPECTIFPEDGGARILCDSPVRAPARGQAAALYQDDRVIGGGWITG